MYFKHRVTPCLVTLALASLSGQLIAAPMSHSASATYVVGGAASVTDTQSSTSFPSTVDVLNSASNAGSNIFYHTYGSVLPGYVNFGSRASGTGVYDMTSPYKLDDYLFTVPGTGLVPVYFNFVIDNGELGVFCRTCTGGGSAQIDIEIRADGVVKGQGQGKLEVDGAGNATLTHSGLVSNYLILSPTSPNTTNVSATDGISYTWGATPVSLYLGNYLGGTDVLIDYDLITSVKGNFGPEDADSYAGFRCEDIRNNVEVIDGVNAVAFAFGEGCYSYSGNTIARSGDPFGQGVSALVTTGVIPEPGSLALVGAGLAAASLIGRRRRPKKTSS